jgi:hypothetical protein
MNYSSPANGSKRRSNFFCDLLLPEVWPLECFNLFFFFLKKEKHRQADDSKLSHSDCSLSPSDHIFASPDTHTRFVSWGSAESNTIGRRSLRNYNWLHTCNYSKQKNTLKRVIMFTLLILTLMILSHLLHVHFYLIWKAPAGTLLFKWGKRDEPGTNGQKENEDGSFQEISSISFNPLTRLLSVADRLSNVHLL